MPEALLGSRQNSAKASVAKKTQPLRAASLGAAQVSAQMAQTARNGESGRLDARCAL
jgi:hypothetical protein